MKPWAEQFYNSLSWTQCRRAYLASIGWVCERCTARGEVTAAKIVHHKTYLTENNIHEPSITLSFDNLEGLCQQCHNEVHHRAPRDRYAFDMEGNVILPPIRRGGREGRTPRAGG